ncbi:hypothetical protein STEG23_031848, partial [Scotinomys teguina]
MLKPMDIIDDMPICCPSRAPEATWARDVNTDPCNSRTTEPDMAHAGHPDWYVPMATQPSNTSTAPPQPPVQPSGITGATDINTSPLGCLRALDPDLALGHSLSPEKTEFIFAGHDQGAQKRCHSSSQKFEIITAAEDTRSFKNQSDQRQTKAPPPNWQSIQSTCGDQKSTLISTGTMVIAPKQQLIPAPWTASCCSQKISYVLSGPQQLRPKKGQPSQGYQPSTAYQVAKRLGTSPHIKAARGDPVGVKGSPEQLAYLLLICGSVFHYR